MKRLVAVLAFAAFAAAARADDGAAVFAQKCAVCHGKDGKGAPAGKALGAKDLTTVKLSEAEIVKVVENGKGKMTGFKGKLSDEQVKSVAKYVKGGLK
ncbi:cytochrome c [Anaeromyxobacter sp. PSR-1]|jgi:cytochrome c6|uniref:c-type cytochrome n=1 Tax=unclassified Anaeromyxobacter TaxID=2620896 RepID=UPI0005E688DB|nr:cytochrome c [Anaeromyxobacter sp. PSR-1]GAO02453.1 cytochrome c6 [Anaeromyxobacter sp. PSR-1]